MQSRDFGRHVTAHPKAAAMAVENKGAHGLPRQPTRYTAELQSVHNDLIGNCLPEAHRTPCTCYLLPWPVIYYKCVVQIVETIGLIEFWKSKKNDK